MELYIKKRHTNTNAMVNLFFPIFRFDPLKTSEKLTFLPPDTQTYERNSENFGKLTRRQD